MPVNDSDYSVARQAADQGVGLPSGASPGAQMHYAQMMEAKHGFGRLFGAAGLPGPPVDPRGVGMLFMLPVIAIIFVVFDLINGWRKWRIAGLLLGLLIGGISFAISVYLGVDADLAGRASEPETNPAIALFLNITGGATVAVIFFLLPRTIIGIVALGALFSAWNYWVSPLL